MLSTIQIQATEPGEPGSTFLRVTPAGIVVSGAIMVPESRDTLLTPSCEISWEQLQLLRQLVTRGQDDG